MKHKEGKQLKELVTTKELSSLLKVTRQTVANWRKEGLPFMKLGRSIRFDYDEVIEWLKERGK